MPRRRIYSELVPLDVLVRSPALPELARRGMQLLFAVQPGQLEGALALLERAAELDLSAGVWPLIDDAHGRWLNPRHARVFETWATQLLDVVEASGAPMDAVVLDLEPPIDEVRAAFDGELRAAKAWLDRPHDTSVHERLLARVQERGHEAVAAVVPTLLLEGRASRGWQRALGTPLDGLDFDRVSAMAYTTLFEGYGLGVVARPDARALLARFAREALARLGSRASLSLGAVGVGALGDEKTYRGPEELADDVAIARYEGIEDLALFDLSGVLAREPIEPWLDAFEAEPADEAPEATARARAVMTAAYVTGVALDVARTEPDAS